MFAFFRKFTKKLKKEPAHVNAESNSVWTIRQGDMRPFNQSMVESEFISLLFGKTIRHHTLFDEEQAAFDAIDRVVKEPAKITHYIPRLPKILPQIISSLRRGEDFKSIANLIYKDPALVAEVTKLMSSPLYKTHQQITSIDHALAMLGQVGVERLVASAVLKPILHHSGRSTPSRINDLLWQQSELAGLGYATHSDAFSFYMANMINNLSVQIVYTLAESAGVNRLQERSHAFNDAFLTKCTTISGVICEYWKVEPKIAALIKREASPQNLQQFDLINTLSRFCIIDCMDNTVDAQVMINDLVDERRTKLLQDMISKLEKNESGKLKARGELLSMMPV